MAKGLNLSLGLVVSSQPPLLPISLLKWLSSSIQIGGGSSRGNRKLIISHHLFQKRQRCDIFSFFFFLCRLRCPSACSGMWEADQISLPWVFASASRLSRRLSSPAGRLGRRWAGGMYGQGRQVFIFQEKHQSGAHISRSFRNLELCGLLLSRGFLGTDKTKSSSQIIIKPSNKSFYTPETLSQQSLTPIRGIHYTRKTNTPS